MSDALPSEDAVAALVDAARRGGLAAEEPRPAPRRSRVREIDSTRPAKFSSDQERRLGRVLDTFCRTASTRLAAELRMPVELELINLVQLTWANAHAQIPDGALCATITARPVGTRWLLAGELQFVLSAIERLLGGGDTGTPPAERKLTEIDAVVAQVLFARLLAQLSAVLNDAAQLELELDGLEGAMDSDQMAGVSEPTLAATVEVRHDRRSSTLMLLVPYAAFAPVADAFTAAAADGMVAPADPDAVEAAVAGVDVVLCAEVAALELPVEAVLGIRPGDVLPLGAPAAGGVALTVLGEPARLVQLVPSSFTVRLTAALDDLGIQVGVRREPGEAAPPALGGITMRVTVELGRARMHAGRVVGLSAGTVVELDAGVDAPLDLLVDGMPFGRARLLVTEDGEWAVQVDEVVPPAAEPGRGAPGGRLVPSS